MCFGEPGGRNGGIEIPVGTDTSNELLFGNIPRCSFGQTFQQSSLIDPFVKGVETFAASTTVLVSCEFPLSTHHRQLARRRTPYEATVPLTKTPRTSCYAALGKCFVGVFFFLIYSVHVAISIDWATIYSVINLTKRKPPLVRSNNCLLV